MPRRKDDKERKGYPKDLARVRRAGRDEFNTRFGFGQAVQGNRPSALNHPHSWYAAVVRRCERGKHEGFCDITIPYLHQLWLNQDGKCAVTGTKLNQTRPIEWDVFGDHTSEGALMYEDHEIGFRKGNVHWVTTPIAGLLKATAWSIDEAKEGLQQYFELMKAGERGKPKEKRLSRQEIARRAVEMALTKDGTLSKRKKRLEKEIDEYAAKELAKDAARGEKKKKP